MQAFRYLGALVALAWMMGSVFDIYNTVTSSSKWLRWLRPLLDILFWLASAGAVFYASYLTDHGRLRVYTFLVLLLGYGLYRVLAHRVVVRGAFGVVRITAALLRLVLRVFEVLVFRPMRAIWRLISWVCRSLYRVGCGLENTVVVVVKFVLGVLTWPLRGPWRHTASFRSQISLQWEGIWSSASKWLKHGSERT